LTALWPHAGKIAYNTFGFTFDVSAFNEACKVIKEQVKMLNTHLTGKTFLVGERFTLADISVFTALILPFGLILDGGFRKAMPAVSAWFERVSKVSHVISSCGHVKMCDKPVKPIDPAKLPVVAAPVAKVIEAPKPAPVVAAKADDCDDLFGEETEEDKAAAAEAKKKAEVAKASKAKPTIIAKSIIVWEIKPYSSLTNIDYVAKKILAIKMDGLVWKTEYKKEPVAYGVFKLIIGAVVEDLKVSTDMVEETVLALEDDQPATKEKIAAEEGADVEEEEEDEDEGNFLVQSVDIQSFNKI